MMNNDLHDLLATMAERYQLSPRLCLFMEEHLHRRVMLRSEFLVRENQVEDKIYTLYRGIALGYYRNEDFAPIGAWVSAGSQVIGNVSEFIYGARTTESVFLIKDSILYYLKREDLYLLNADFPELPSLYYKILKEQQALYQVRRYCRDIKLHLERIQRFYELYPDIIHQLPKQFIASYLGMARETYSRLFQRLKK